MKRLLVSLLALLMVLTLAVPAHADVMWEPDNNSFYYRHESKCEYENRSYYANSPDGFVTLLDAPGGSMVRGQFENGEKLRIYFIYNNEEGLAAYWVDGKETSGWVPMSELTLVYDYISFEEEYADKITEYNGEFADYDGEVEVVNFYPYPGAPQTSQSFDIAKLAQHMGNILGNLTGTSGHPSYISSIFVDEDGRTWGYVNYMYGHLNSWFCLDAPDGTDFPVREVSTPNLTPPQSPVLPATAYVPYVLVGVVVAVTAGMLGFFYRKKKRV